MTASSHCIFLHVTFKICSAVTWYCTHWLIELNQISAVTLANQSCIFRCVVLNYCLCFDVQQISRKAHKWIPLRGLQIFYSRSNTLGKIGYYSCCNQCRSSNYSNHLLRIKQFHSMCCSGIKPGLLRNSSNCVRNQDFKFEPEPFAQQVCWDCWVQSSKHDRYFLQVQHCSLDV